MLREAENIVRIEGILSETEIKLGSYVKDGKTVETIGGVIKVRVDQNINGEAVQLEIPVHLFSNKFTKAGKPNPAYESIERIMNDYVSIAAAGGEAGADAVRITSGKIQMNEFPSKTTGEIVSYPRITTSFVSKIKKEELKPEATFSIEFLVADAGYELNKNGEETGRYKIQGVIPQYNEKVDVVPFYATTQGVIDAVSSYWGQNDTVKAVGRLNFSFKTETYMETPDFGEPIERTRTTNISEFIITGGTQTPLEGEKEFSLSEIQAALARRKADLEQKKKDGASAKKAPAPSGTTSSKPGLDLGF